MAAERNCYRCGSSTLETGRVQSTGRIHFHVEDPKIMTLHTGYVPIISTMCLDCGAIEFIGEVNKARKISKKANDT